MGSTYHSIHFHLVFATKDRVPVIRSEWRSGLHGYLGGAAEAVRRYIANQEEHHRTIGFREEFQRLLERNGVTYDPQYLP